MPTAAACAWLHWHLQPIITEYLVLWASNQPQTHCCLCQWQWQYRLSVSKYHVTALGLLPTPRTCVRAEHSTYLTALSSRASFSPLSQVRARCLFLASFSRVLLSSLRSTWVPTSRNGVRGQWCEISGTHCEETKLKKHVFLLHVFRFCPKDKRKRHPGQI